MYDTTDIRIEYHKYRRLRALGRTAAARDTLRTFLRPGVGMVTYILLYLASFHWIENMTRLQYTHIHVALDDLIPFCEIFVIPYLMWFAYMIFTTGLLFLFDRENYHKTATMLYIGMTLFVVVSLIWPNIQYLRPDVMPRDNVCTRLVSALYRTDTPTNLCPSIHVFNTLAAMIGIHRSRLNGLARNVIYRTFMYLLGASIILSTMFIKQHSVFDVVCAFVCIGVSYYAVYRCGFSLSGESNTLVLGFRKRRERLPRRVHG